MRHDALALFGGPATIISSRPHYVWPRITAETEKAVVTQLHTSVSIYNRGGIIKEFEDSFASYHSMRFSLLNNSGTNAIHAAAVGIDIRPGDEVICPVYTFFATASPLLTLGAVPILCDSGPDGNIDPSLIESLVTERTRAVMVTHMWGIPCNMGRIQEICKRLKLRLLEDCSHAHGGSFQNQKLGTFGDAGIWSLQGQKIVTGGEGGILLTNDKEVYYRATLLGHYNKRASQEIPKAHQLHEFCVTGFGLKHRAHPLAVALAMEQFGQLDEWLAQKSRYAKKISACLENFPFLIPPRYDPKVSSPAWYAYVFNYDESKANGVSLEMFEKALLAEGLVELDRPSSTRPLNQLSLFITPSKAFPGLYSTDEQFKRNNRGFPCAERFYQTAFKLPMWAFEDEERIVDQYIAGLSKVAMAVQTQPDALKQFELAA